MSRRVVTAFAVVCAAVTASPLLGDEVRTVTINGTAYRETWRTVNRPVTRVEWQRREVTEWVDQHVTEMREWDRTVYTPRVRYEWQPRLRNRWNLFAPPYWSYELVPRTTWSARAEKVRVPVSYRRVVPEKRVVQVPERSLGFESQRELVARVPAGPSTAVGARSAPPLTPTPQLTPTPYTAQRMGGLQRYEGEFPRHSVTTSLR